MSTLLLSVDATTSPAGVLFLLADVLRKYPDNQRVQIKAVTSDEPVVMTFSNKFSVDAYNPLLRQEVEALGILWTDLW